MLCHDILVSVSSKREVLSEIVSSSHLRIENTCVRILSSCDMFYEFTTYPNNITTTSREADQTLLNYQVFYSGPTFNCSPYSHLFVCLALSPHCDTGGLARPPCASLCDLVYGSCLAKLQSLGGPVIDSACLLNCNRLVLLLIITFTVAFTRNCHVPHLRYPSTDCVDANDPLALKVVPSIFPTATPTTEPPTGTGMTMVTNSSGECPETAYFTDSAKDFALGWLAFWSTVCFISTTLTIATFLLDTSRFQYPWRPMVYLALSFNFHSLTHFFAMALGRNLITCPGGEFVQTSIRWSWGHTPCILVFGLLYFTMMAAFLWWLMLSLSWFLASAFSWSNEAVAHLAPLYHVVAWVLPLLLTIILVATRVVGADELTAICFIVRDDSDMSFYALLLGVIVPLIVCLITGIVFLTIGFVSLLRIHSIMRHSGKARESTILEKLMIRIGVFVLVFIIPAIVVIGCFLYELITRPSWTGVNEPCGANCTQANPAVFMVRLFMFLLTGILTGVWIWSRKTVLSWKNIPQRLASCCRRTGPATVTSAVNIGHRDTITSVVLEQEASDKL